MTVSQPVDAAEGRLHSAAENWSRRVTGHCIGSKPEGGWDSWPNGAGISVMLAAPRGASPDHARRRMANLGEIATDTDRLVFVAP